jgi:hypothetical protein
MHNIVKKCLRVGAICGAVLLVTAGIFKSTQAWGRDYLPWVGPVPLRFAKAPAPLNTNDLQPIAPVKAEHSPEKPSEKNPPPAGASSSNPLKSETANSANVSTNWQTIFDVPPMELRSMNQGEANHFVVSSLNSESAKMTGANNSANDLLNISPDMLIHYFKSNEFPTNQANVSVFAPVQFIPPAPTASGVSRAVYRQTP